MSDAGLFLLHGIALSWRSRKANDCMTTHLIRAIGLWAAIAVTSLSFGQRGDYYLGDAPWYLTNAVGQKTLTQMWVTDSGYTQSYVETNIYPQLFARFNGLGWTDAEIMLFNVGPAAHNEAVLRGQGGGQPITGRITSNNGVRWPPGTYAVNFPCIIDGGEYLGAGTGFSASGGASTTQMNTTLTLNRTGWLGGVRVDGQYTASGGVVTDITFDSMNLIQSTTWQMLSGSFSYSESGYVDGFRLSGDNGSWLVSTYTSHGLATWDLGETYKIGRIFAETFNGYGWACVRGTPASADCISSFQNAMGGVGFIGTELNTIRIETLSGDDNPALMVQQSGYGRGAGGVISVVLGKSESGKRTPNKGQILLWQRDPCYGLVNVDDAQCDMTNLFVDAMIVTKTNTAALGNVVHAQLRGWNCRTLVHDVTSGVRWPAISYRPERISWSYRNGASKLFDELDGVLLTSSSVNATDRLGLVANNGAFDYVAGTPVYDIYGGGTPPPPPPACSWVVGAWGPCGPCVSNQCTQTRSVTSSVVGCVPTDPMPVTTQAVSCGSPPPGPTPLYVLTPFNNSNPSASINLNPDIYGVKRIVLTNVTFTVSAFNYQRILCGPNDAAGLRAVPSNGNGTTCRFRTSTGAYATTSVANVTKGTLYPTLEIILPASMTVDRLLAPPGQGSAMLLTCDKIELFAQ